MLTAAGLEGIARKLDPGRRCDHNSYTEPTNGQVKKLPTNLLDAMRCLEQSDLIKRSLGEPFVNAYLKLKYMEWHSAHSQVTPWELEYTLDC